MFKQKVLKKLKEIVNCDKQDKNLHKNICK